MSSRYGARARALVGFFLLAALAVAPQARATTMIQVPTQVLVTEAVAIVIGQVTAIQSFWDTGHNQIFTHIALDLDEILKGDLAESRLTLKQVGGTVGDLQAWIFGNPEFVLGEKVLLFLRPNADGTLRVAHLNQGKFTVLFDVLNGEEVAYRDLRSGGIRVMTPGAPPPDYDLHPLREFGEWIRGIVRTVPQGQPQSQVGPSTWVTSPLAPESGQVQEQFALLDPQAPARWFQPDTSLPVAMLLNSQGEPAAAGLGFNQVRAAYQAWSTVPGSPFRYQDGGFTSAVGFQFDGVNAVSFRDPLNQMDSPSGCSGVLAIGGYFRSGSQTTTVNGQIFYKTLEGDLVFNDGWAGCGFLENDLNLSEVATHELGHVGGLGHSSDSNATMYAFAHFDGRGASLTADDIAGWQFIYPASGGGGGTADITVTPLSLSFGSVAVGSQSTTQPVTVRNDGTANLTITTITLGGANPGDFQKPSTQDLCSGKTLSPGQSCTVGVRFRPGSSGAKSATLAIPSSDPDENPVNVALDGTGGSGGGGGGGTADIAVTPLSLSFGSVAVGSQSTTQPVTVRNDGTANLTITTITLGGANPGDFQKPSTQDLCSGKTLSPGQSCTVGVRFQPGSAGTKSATLVIPSSDPDENPVDVALDGTGGSDGGGGGGTADITVTPVSLGFGNVRVGRSSSKVVTVRNDGTGDLTISTITLGGANPGDFQKPSTQDLCTGKTLGGGQSCTVSVRFRPTSTGAKSGTLVIPSTDPDENPVTVTLTGTGT